MSKYLIYSNHSRTNEHLARLSMSNHWEYSAYRYYDVLFERIDWVFVMQNMYASVKRLLDIYDVVMLVGSDVLFTNFDRGIEDILKPDDNIVLAHEPTGWRTLVNFGVILFCNTPATREFIDLIHAKRPEWSRMRLIHQDWVSDNLGHPTVQKALRIVKTREMNSPIYGADEWQPGDWLAHFYGHLEKNKSEVMQKFVIKNSDNINRFTHEYGREPRGYEPENVET